MKPRKVIVALELLTDASIKNLREKNRWVYTGTGGIKVIQVQANVIKKKD